MQFKLFPLLAGAAILLAAPVKAEVSTFDTSQSPFTAGRDNQGWYGDYNHPLLWSVGSGYFTGKATSSNHTRSFFTFDLRTLDLSNQSIVSATLMLTRYEHTRFQNHPTLEYSLWSVETDAETLNTGVLNNPNFNIVPLFNDLGSGTAYGAHTVSLGGSREDVLNFELNEYALADISAAAGNRFFSLGGKIRGGGSSSAGLFSRSGKEGVQQLVIQTRPNAVPEPGTIALISTGLLSLARFAVRRRRQ